MSQLIGSSELMESLRARIRAASRVTGAVLISGETGVGKELVARAIHDYSQSSGRFIAVDCGALPEDLIESELFGHRRGAFTTAVADKPGLIEEANRGTLFLDEIANTSLRFQAKLLRVLQDREVRRVGEVTSRRVDIRVIAATNASLPAMVQAGSFREDLYYRLNVMTVVVPPLRRRREDIPGMVVHFLNRLGSATGTRKELLPDALTKLMGYSFPGNVRELENIIENAFYTAESRSIGPDEILLPYETFGAAPAEAPDLVVLDFWESIARPLADRSITRAQVQALIRRGLEQSEGNYRRLVTRLGMPDSDYKKFMDFLRRYHCNVDFRPYRRKR